MKNFTSGAKWIWLHGEESENEYGEFLVTFSTENSTASLLKISCDGVYAVYLNGEPLAFSQCSDSPNQKAYQEITFAPCVGENEMIIRVWHIGVNTAAYAAASPKLLFEGTQGENLLFASGENTPARRIALYDGKYLKKITMQLGLSFFADLTKGEEKWGKSVAVDGPKTLRKTERENLLLEERPNFTAVKSAESWLVDLGEEVSGFLDLEVESECEQTLLVAFGEHIVDGGVRRLIGNRDFSVELRVPKGKSQFLGDLRRIAGRYLEIFPAKGTASLTLQYAGIRPLIYPVKVKNYCARCEEEKAIYEACLRTLRLCMHEHYEDTPWREQGLYALDSRNQMLCGYYAFEDTKRYARENLLLLGGGLREDGLLHLTPPSPAGPPIPFFSLVFILQTYEYIAFTGDKSVLDEVGETLDRIMQTFAKRVDESGLLCNFPNPFWNFYEWTKAHSGSRTEEDQKDGYDLILNCAFLYVLPLYNKMRGGRYEFKGMREKIKEVFYDREEGLYRASTTSQYSSGQLGLAFALLSGVAEKEDTEKLLVDMRLEPASLSTRAFVYDALLKAGEKYKPQILEDIRIRYGAMLKTGSSTFWETEEGEQAFLLAGSLCHGWSAIPAYYYRLLGVVTDEK